MKYTLVILAFALGLASAFKNEACACDRTYFPICGSDGTTYNNYCLLKCQQKVNPELTGVSYGRCEEQKLVEEPVCVCNRMYLPVCGSDGVTYSNPCVLRCQQKKNHELTMEHYGACENNVETKAVCPAACPLIWAPVCGSDGNTYASICNFNCKQTQIDGLTLAHHGACEKVQENEMPICACPFNYDPICGTDGKTYGNMCGLKCEQKANSELQVAYKGECQKMPVCACALIYAPVCGSDGKTYSNMCALNCQQKVNSGLSAVYHGVCHHEAVCACTREYNPICGSDGRTYGNPCTFRCQQKNDNGLTMVHHGEC